MRPSHWPPRPRSGGRTSKSLDTSLEPRFGRLGSYTYARCTPARSHVLATGEPRARSMCAKDSPMNRSRPPIPSKPPIASRQSRLEHRRPAPMSGAKAAFSGPNTERRGVASVPRVGVWRTGATAEARWIASMIRWIWTRRDARAARSAPPAPAHWSACAAPPAPHGEVVGSAAAAPAQSAQKFSTSRTSWRHGGGS